MRNSTLVQCELYRRLVNDGFDVIPEYRIRAHHIRADIAVMDSDRPAYLIEAKDTPRNPDRTGSRQWKKYAATGIPFVYCNRLADVESVVAHIEQELQHIRSCS